MLNEVRQIAESIGRRMVVATVDENGVANLSPEFIVDVTETSILFCKFPGTRTLQNIRKNPKGAVAVINWTIMKGFQVKGLMRQVASYTPSTEAGKAMLLKMQQVGAPQLVELVAAEIFDVFPKENQTESLWKSAGFSEYASFKIRYPDFVKPDYEPASLIPFKSDLNRHIQTLLENKFNSFVGTVETNGSPNVSPRFLLEAADNFLLWGDKFKNKTFLNFSRPSPITVNLIDWNKMDGYQAKGWATFHFFGETLIKVNDYWKKFGITNPFQAVHFRVEELEYITLGPTKPLMAAHDRQTWVGSSGLQSTSSAQPSSIQKPEEATLKQDESREEIKTTQGKFSVLIGGSHTDVNHILESGLKKKPVQVLKDQPSGDAEPALSAGGMTFSESETDVKVILTSFFNQPVISESDFMDSFIQTMKSVRLFLASPSGKKISKIVILLPVTFPEQQFRSELNLLEDYLKTQIALFSPNCSLLFLSLPDPSQHRSQEFENWFTESVYNMLTATYLGYVNYITLK